MECYTSFTDLERLREALIELDWVRRHEHSMRMETESLLRGLRVLNDARDTPQLFDRLAAVLQELVPFHDAMMLVSNGRGVFHADRATARRYLGLRWMPKGLLPRILAGETVAIFDTRQVPDWRELPTEVLNVTRSAIMMPIRSSLLSAVMIFVHAQPAFFTPAHLQLLKRFAPLIDQALASIEVRESLERERNLAQAATLEKLREIQERRKAEEEIQRVRDLMGSAIGFAPIYLWEIDASGRYTFVEGTQKVLGHPPDDLIGRLAPAYYDPDSDAHGLPHLMDIINRHQPFENLVLRRCKKDGTPMWVSISGSPVSDADGHFMGYRGVTMDVTETVAAKLKMEDMALHDALTGLANRRKFMDHFDAARARFERFGQPVSLLALDIDHFKRINDTYGHPVGDDVLIAIAKVLERSVRRTDLAARFGGEEFMVLLPDADTVGAVEVAEKLRMELEDEAIPVEVGGQKDILSVTVSAGVATMRADTAASFDDLVERADQALYVAKMTGRNRVCVEGTDPPPAL